MACSKNVRCDQAPCSVVDNILQPHIKEISSMQLGVYVVPLT